MNALRMAVLCMVMFSLVATGVLHAQDARKTEDPKKAEEAKKAEEDKVTGSAAISFLNRYVWRGYEVGKSGLVIQPSAGLSYKGFSLALWNNIDTNQRNTTIATFAHEGRKGFNETDLTLSYTYPVGKLSLTGGYIYYNLKYAEETEEFFVTLAYDMLTKPTLSVYQDINSYPGTYVNLSFAHSLPIYKEITLDLGAAFGYYAGQGDYWKTYETSTGGYTGSKYKGFHDGMVKAGFTIPVTKAFSVQPMVQYYFPLSGDAKKTMGTDATTGVKIPFNHMGHVPTSLVGGINLTYSF
jgi:hypothetical protein